MVKSTDEAANWLLEMESQPDLRMREAALWLRIMLSFAEYNYLCRILTLKHLNMVLPSFFNSRKCISDCRYSKNSQLTAELTAKLSVYCCSAAQS